MFKSIFSTPISFIISILSTLVVTLIVVGFALFFFNYAAERMYLEQCKGQLDEILDSYGGLKDYSRNNRSIFRNDSSPSGLEQLEKIGGSVSGHEPPSLQDIMGAFNGGDGMGLVGSSEYYTTDGQMKSIVSHPPRGGEVTSDKVFNPASTDDLDFCNTTRYSIELNCSTTKYVGATLTYTLYRDVVFKLPFYTEPIVIEMKTSGSYVYNRQYDPSDLNRREPGVAYVE